MDIINKSVTKYREGIAARAQAKAGEPTTPPGSHAPPGTYSGVKAAAHAAKAASGAKGKHGGTPPSQRIGLRSLRPGSSSKAARGGLEA